MPYYMGDYMGDYYAGDPGIFSRLASFLGARRTLGRAGMLAKIAAPLLPGGGILAKAGTALSRAASMGKMVVRAHPAGTAVAGAVASAGAIAAVRHRGSPAGAGMAMGPMRGLPAGPEAGFPMRGFHISRRTGALVRNRRMRVTNPKALRRAIRRATGFARLARRVLHFTSPKAPKGRAIFRTKKPSTTKMKA